MIKILKRVYGAFEVRPIVGLPFRVFRRFYLEFMAFLSFRKSYPQPSASPTAPSAEIDAVSDFTSISNSQPPFRLDVDLQQPLGAPSVYAATETSRLRAAFEIYRIFLHLDSFTAVSEVMDEYCQLMEFSPAEYPPLALWKGFLRGNNPSEMADWCLNVALQLVSDFSEAHFARGVRLVQADPHRAVEHLKACTQGRHLVLTPHEVSVHYRAWHLMGQIFATQGRDSEALDALRQIPEGTVIPDAHRLHAELCVKEGLTSEAITNINLAMEHRAYLYAVPPMPTSLTGG